MNLHERIKDISKKFNLSHLGSNLTAVNIISDIYHKKKPNEPFILSAGHSSLALYCVLELREGKDAEALYKKHGTHPNRDLEDGIYCSTGSLGMGIGIAVGMAMADRSRDVYCLISDGESYEGILYEVANMVHRYNITNLKLYCNYNGLSAYSEVPSDHMARVALLFPEIRIIKTSVREHGFNGLEAHYLKI